MPFLEQGTLANGLRVVFHSDKRLPLVQIHLCLLSGSRHDSAGRSGLAHLCEHLAYKGPNTGVLSYTELIHRVGGMTDASTFHDRITYTDSLPTHHLALGLWVAAERLAGHVADFSDGQLDIERSILLQEYRQRSDRFLHDKPLEQLNRLLYPAGHPYHRSPGGVPEEIQAITGDDVAAHLRDHYSPRKAVLVLVGDLSDGDAEAKVELYLGAVPVGPPLCTAAPFAFEPAEGERRQTLLGRSPHVRAYLGYRIGGFGQPGWYAAALLARALAVGRSSPLQRILVGELALAQEVRVLLDTMRDAGTLVFIVTGAPDVDSERLTAALVDTVDRLVAAGLSEAWLARARKKALSDHYAAIQYPIRRASLVACWAAYHDDPGALDQEAARFAALGVDEVQRQACEILHPDQRVIVSIVPEGAVP